MELETLLKLVIPVLVFCATQLFIYHRVRQGQREKEMSLVKAIYGELRAIESYLESHILRVNYLKEKREVKIREIKFLYLQSSVVDSGILSSVGDL